MFHILDRQQRKKMIGQDNAHNRYILSKY